LNNNEKIVERCYEYILNRKCDEIGLKHAGTQKNATIDYFTVSFQKL
tara:strand:+ start:385 stop:525 length:141 start_codon:yes stop_codon:yes gene_type:complete